VLGCPTSTRIRFMGKGGPTLVRITNPVRGRADGRNPSPVRCVGPSVAGCGDRCGPGEGSLLRKLTGVSCFHGRAI
jgi:hypothetical protein